MTAPASEEVTADSLDKSLNDLIAAADASEALTKGDPNNISHSGRVDEDGKGGGGRASNTGSLDKMMIAKMAQAGLDAGTIADFEAFMVGKMPKKGDDDYDEDEMEAMKAKLADMEAKMKMKGYGKMGSHDKDDPAHAYKSETANGEPTLSKSMDQFRGDKDVAEGLDVSPFLEALTAQTATQIDALNQELVKGLGTQAGVNKAMALATYEMGMLVKSQHAVIGELGKRLGIVESQPAPAKGATNVTGAQALQKSLQGEAGAAEQLNKAETCSVLNFMNLEKGQKTIGGQNAAEAVCMLEAGGTIAQEVLDAASQFIAQNPNEAKQARAYH